MVLEDTRDTEQLLLYSVKTRKMLMLPDLEPQLPVLLLRRVGFHGGKVLHAVQQTRPGGFLLQGVVVPGRMVLTLEQLSLGCRHQDAACSLCAPQHHLRKAKQNRVRIQLRTPCFCCCICEALGLKTNISVPDS